MLMDRGGRRQHKSWMLHSAGSKRGVSTDQVPSGEIAKQLDVEESKESANKGPDGKMIMVKVGESQSRR